MGRFIFFNSNRKKPLRFVFQLLALLILLGQSYFPFLIRAEAAETITLTISGVNYTLTEVTSQTKTILLGLRYNRATGTYLGFSNVTNTSNTPLKTPLIMVFESFSNSSISLANPDGSLTSGKPYKNFTSLISGGELSAGKVTSNITLEFKNPKNVSIGFTAKIFANVKLNNPPVAHVGPDQDVKTKTLVTLDGSASGDPDGDPITYNWTILTRPSGSTSNLDNPALVKPTFTPDVDGDYQIQLIVSDGKVDSLPVTMVVRATTPPPLLGLTVNPVTSPTFQTTQALTGNILGTPGGPPPEPEEPPVISSLSINNGRQGQTLAINITGTNTHFKAGVSQLTMGFGITVNSLDILSPTSAMATISIANDAPLGAHPVIMTTGSEGAAGIGFNVTEGVASLSGVLRDPVTGNPIGGATISIKGNNISTTSLADGTFVLNGVPSGVVTLLINAPNYDLLSQPLTIFPGATISFGEVKLTATVGTPGAGGTIYNVLASNITDLTGSMKLPDIKRAIVDAILLVGGSEMGVLDENGNQMNPDVVGDGLVTLTREGVNWLADKMQRGESISLQELLFAFNYGLEWSNGQPLTLQDWLSGLQELINQVWADPNNENNYLPIIIFSKETIISPEPPVIGPETRLNAFQSYLFVSSLLSEIVRIKTAQIPIQRRILLANNRFSNKVLSDAPLNLGILVAQAGGPPPPTSKPRITTFWRNFFKIKSQYLTANLQQVFYRYNLAINGNLFLYPLMVLGEVPAMFMDLKFAELIPEPPKLTEVTKRAEDNVVEIIFKRSLSDKTDKGMPDDSKRFQYTLYRFKNIGRSTLEVVDNSRVFLPNQPGGPSLIFRDPKPPEGTYYYAMTATRLHKIGQLIPTDILAIIGPTWSPQIMNRLNPYLLFLRGVRALTSDYSNPIVFNFSQPIGKDRCDPIEIGSTKDVYCSNIEKKEIVKISKGGAGTRSTFAYTNFGNPKQVGIAQVGLAIDSNDDLYTDNSASDSQFGGRIFQFPQFCVPECRVFVGSVNYFSLDLSFAHPASVSCMTIGPKGDLFVVDEITRTVKRIPINAPIHPSHRCGRTYFNIPDGGGERIIDMTFDEEKTLYLLDSIRILKVPYDAEKDQAKGYTHYISFIK